MSPPIPTLPPASDLQRYNSSPPDFMSPIRRYGADERAQQLVFDAWEVKSPAEKFRLCTEALQIFPFSVDALNCMAHVYSVSYPSEEDALEKAERTYQLAVDAAKLMWPDLEGQESIPWGHVEHRPFLRAYHGLGVVQNDRGKVREALQHFRFLLRVNPNDNQGVRTLLFQALIELGDYDEAEQIAEKHSNGRESTESYFRFGFVLIDFLKNRQGSCSRKDLENTLAKALQNNNFVIPMLLGDIPLPPRPEYVSQGSMDEAASIVNSAIGVWKRVPGVLEWLEETRCRGGQKPDDDGTLLFKLLQRGRILLELNAGTLLEVSSKVDLMPGRALDTFCLAPGMKDHNPMRIVAYQFNREANRDDYLSNFVSFSYEDVKSLPFWQVLDSSTFGSNDENTEHHCNKCFEPATLKCSACKVTWYCGRACQKDDWSGKGDRGFGPSHKVMCKKYIKR